LFRYSTEKNQQQQQQQQKKTFKIESKNPNLFTNQKDEYSFYP